MNSACCIRTVAYMSVLRLIANPLVFLCTLCVALLQYCKLSFSLGVFVVQQPSQSGITGAWQVVMKRFALCFVVMRHLSQV